MPQRLNVRCVRNFVLCELQRTDLQKSVPPGMAGDGWREEAYTLDELADYLDLSA